MAGVSEARFVGHGRAQVAQRALRQRHRFRAASRALRAAMATSAAYLLETGEARARPFHARALAAGARRGDLGGLRSLGRTGVADLVERNCRHAAPLRRRAARGRLHGAQRGHRQPGAGFLRRRRDHPPVIAGVQAEGTCWAAAPSGRDTPPCASVYPPGPPQKPTSSAASRRSSRWRMECDMLRTGEVPSPPYHRHKEPPMNPQPTDRSACWPGTTAS